MTAPDRMLVWLREAMDAAERIALAAREGGEGRWHHLGDRHGGSVAGDHEGYHVACDEGYPTLEQATHIALHDPAAVLRRIAADRQLLDDLIAEQHNVVEDPAYTCPAATSERDGGRNYHPGACNCGRDERVQRRGRLLAEGYGWTEEKQR